jgi:hypothetical protein
LASGEYMVATNFPGETSRTPLPFLLAMPFHGGRLPNVSTQWGLTVL